jgi:gliding motility-associated-like protein
MRFYKPLLIALLLILPAGKLFATHYYGVDLYYTYVSGNTYKVTIVAYGDCSGTQFPSFATSRPQIFIKKGNTDFLNDFLEPEPPREGIEVTPVCPAELNNTTCKNINGSVPGVKKFVYSKEFTLSGPAPDWKFIYAGTTDGNVLAGRSVSLTNVAPPGIIRLEATLDNTEYANSAPVYTTIATPFYCVNRQVNFNPGAVDADLDSLVYELVPGLDSNGIPVNYISGYTGANPLAVAQGKFSFSTRTGQLNFTPNQIQKSLVVYRVFEYRNGKLLGTSMREMTVVVLPCENNPPVGYITNANGATIVDSVTVMTCKGSHEVAFDINPFDADAGHIINMVVNGLPGDSKLDITDNNTTRPTSRFVWNMPALADGDYTFYVTYTDDGCPIASKQTLAYTIRIGPQAIFAEASRADCRSKGSIKITVPGGWSPWNFGLYNEAGLVYSKERVGGEIWRDSMVPGRYKVQVTNHYGCIAEATVEIPSRCYIADIPTAFSPNSDGRNDILLVRGENVEEMYLVLYNRWGQRVFESREINHGWDGTFNGQDAPIESYAYSLSVVFRNKEVYYKQGNITLLR